MLKAQAERLGIAERCTWLGAQPQKQVFAALARADLFVLASKKAADGDQDGLPNVLMEAAHQGLAIVSTRAAAIGEFIEDGDNGLLVPPASEALAAALARMIGHPDLRQQFAHRAAETVRTRFSFDAGVDWIASALIRTSAARPSCRRQGQRSSHARAVAHAVEIAGQSHPLGRSRDGARSAATAAPARSHGGDAGAEPRPAGRARIAGSSRA